jgi:hypothetical protein
VHNSPVCVLDGENEFGIHVFVIFIVEMQTDVIAYIGLSQTKFEFPFVVVAVFLCLGDFVADIEIFDVVEFEADESWLEHDLNSRLWKQKAVQLDGEVDGDREDETKEQRSVQSRGSIKRFRWWQVELCTHSVISLSHFVIGIVWVQSRLSFIFGAPTHPQQENKRKKHRAP